MEGYASDAVRKVQGFVSAQVFRSFKQRALDLDISMQSAIEEAIGDWLRKNSPEEKSSVGVIGLLDEIESLVRRVREFYRRG
jgi:hypothetical protein